MKQLIVLTASIMLGVVIVNLVAGPSESSIYSSVGRLWLTEAQYHQIGE